MPAYIHSNRGSALFLHERRVAVSRTTPYNSQVNGLSERYNGIICKTVQLAVANRKSPDWESLLPKALYAISTLLCTVTNATPHERFFSFPRRSSASNSLPSWLVQPGTVLLKLRVRPSKHDTLVSELELIEANLQYALV